MDSSTSKTEARQEVIDYLKILNGPPQDLCDQLTRLPHFALYVTRHLISESSPGKQPKGTSVMSIIVYFSVQVCIKLFRYTCP